MTQDKIVQFVLRLHNMDVAWILPLCCDKARSRECH